MTAADRALEAMPPGSHLRALQLAANRARDLKRTVQVRSGVHLLYNVSPDGTIQRCFDPLGDEDARLNGLLLSPTS